MLAKGFGEAQRAEPVLLAGDVSLQHATLKETPTSVCITSESLLAVFCATMDNVNIYDWNISTK